MSQAQEPVTVGLVGAGPWARMMYAPMLTGGPETRLAGVWARRADAAGELAGEYGVPAFTEYGELLAACDAVAFAVPPDVQARMATEAARAGRAVLLDKPIGLTLDEAHALTEAVDAAGVVNQLVLSNRYRPRIRRFLAEAAAFPTIGAQARMVTGAFVTGPFTTPWRLEYGSLHDIGPHALDLLDAAVGEIEDLWAVGDPRGWVAVTCRHAGGAISQLALTGEVAAGGYAEFELYGPDGPLTLDFRELGADQADGDAGWAAVRTEFAAAVRSGRPHPIDVHRGLRLQRLIDRALTSLRAH
ncbi:MAG: Gfo/Idh/MocA family oxidoreductase [Actinocatenispora sp.]